MMNFFPVVLQWSYSHNSSRHKSQCENICALVAQWQPFQHDLQQKAEKSTPMVPTNWFIIRVHPAPLFSDSKCVFNGIEIAVKNIFLANVKLFFGEKPHFCFTSV